MVRIKSVPVLAVAGCALLLVLAAFPLSAAPKAELWPRWQAHQPADTRAIGHAPWSRFLGRYLVTGHPSGINRLDYAGVDAAGRALLDGYLDALQAVGISGYNRREQLAFWINLYNAATVQVVLRHWPVDSITDIDISPGWFSFGPWDARLLRVEGVGLTLNDVEHRILRPIWGDPRLHYAVNCASLGCPNLAPVAFTAATTGAMLEQAARDYINHPRGVSLGGGGLRLSRIYDWFQADFGGGEAGVIAHLAAYLPPAKAAALRAHRGRIRYAYDWTVNAP